MKLAGMELPSPTQTAYANLKEIMDGSNWRLKEAVCMLLANGARLRPGTHSADCAQTAADYFVGVMSGVIK